MANYKQTVIYFIPKLFNHTVSGPTRHIAYSKGCFSVCILGALLIFTQVAITVKTAVMKSCICTGVFFMLLVCMCLCVTYPSYLSFSTKFASAFCLP